MGMFGLSGLATSLLGGLALITLVLGYNTWENHQIRVDTRAEVAAEARARAMVLIEQRRQDDVEISSQDMATLCAELGGRWVPNEDRCD